MANDCDTTESIGSCMEIFNQDGVQLRTAPAYYHSYISLVGTIYVTEYLNSNRKRCIEWKPNDITVDADVQDQEWAMVNTTQKRSRTLSESLPPDPSTRAKFIKVNFDEIKSFKSGNKGRQFTLFDGKSEVLCSFQFHNGSCEQLITVLRGMVTTCFAKRDKHLYVVLSHDTLESQQLNTSFAELNLFQDSPGLTNSWWKIVKNFHDRPLESTLESFAKVTDFVYRSPDQRDMDDQQRAILNRSLTEYESTQMMQGDYEVIAKVPELPERKDYPRGKPLTMEQWNNIRSADARIEDIEQLKMLIFRGGLSPNVRSEVWKYLLDYYPWDSSKTQREHIVIQKANEYYNMKMQWKRMTKVQEDNFADFRERKSLIEKDVNRTDRALDYYAGDDNPNLKVLYDILMTYVMYNFDLGYVQGMSDLLSPILYLLKNEVDTFWCFVGFMNKVCANFELDQSHMKAQLENLHTLLGFVEPELVNYLDKHDSGNMFFCFRWLLVLFKRELSYEECMRFWEVLWTGLPCQNFHLLVSVAILENEKQVLMSNNYGFTEILKHVNDMCGKHDMESMLARAEGIYHQIKDAEHITDNIKLILGLPILKKQPSPDIETLTISPEEEEEDTIYEEMFNKMETVNSNF